jgi:hypothetical protein
MSSPTKKKRKQAPVEKKAASAAKKRKTTTTSTLSKKLEIIGNSSLNATSSKYGAAAETLRMTAPPKRQASLAAQKYLSGSVQRVIESADKGTKAGRRREKRAFHDDFVGNGTTSCIFSLSHYTRTLTSRLAIVNDNIIAQSSGK